MVDKLRSLPKVGVDAALCEVMEEIDEELSARARGAKGGGLLETGGLNGRVWRCNTSYFVQNEKTQSQEQKINEGEREGKRKERAFPTYQVCDRFPRGQLWSGGRTRRRRRRDWAASRLRCGRTSWR